MRFSLLFATLLAAGHTYAADSSLQAVFQRMDAASDKFKGFTADFVKIDHHDFVNDNDKATGTIAVRKAGPKSLQVLETWSTLNGQPDGEAIELNGTHLSHYYPKTNTVQEDDLGKKYNGLVDEVLLLGLGGNSKDLQQNYKVTFGGPEAVNGAAATRLLLNPNDPELAKLFPKIEIWISDDTGIAMQHKLYEKGGADYHIQTYSNVKLGPVAESQVKLNLPKGVTREHLIPR